MTSVYILEAQCATNGPIFFMFCFLLICIVFFSVKRKTIFSKRKKCKVYGMLL